MLERNHGSIVFTCDNCFDVLEPDSKDFSEAMEEFRNAGWKATRTGDEWGHSCEVCKSL